VKIDAAKPFVRHNQRLLTRRVGRKARGIARHAQRDSPQTQKPETAEFRLKKVCACRGAATLGRCETAPRLVRRATRSRSDPPRVHRRDLGFDEYGAQTRTLPARPKVLRAAVPHGHYKTVTLVAGLRLCGLVAQKAFDRPINAASFEEWVEKCLVPTLSKGDIVVMDNLSSHKGPRVEQLIKAAGAELRYLPPYSPDMNPIE